MSRLKNILFLDIETVSQHPNFNELDERGQSLWKQKIGYLARQDEREWTTEDYARSYGDRAAIYAEFGKVIVISAGVIVERPNEPMVLRIKSFYGHDERVLLEEFAELLNTKFNNPAVHILCGHNVREFDVPWLCRRMTIHGIPLPALLDIHGKKPWEVRHIADTLELWKFGDYKHFTSLDLLAYILGIPSPKGDLDGSKVGVTYWKEEDLGKIRDYCELDVFTVAQVYLKLTGKEVLPGNNFIRADA